MRKDTKKPAEGRRVAHGVFGGLDFGVLGDYFSILDTLAALREVREIIKRKRKDMGLEFDKNKSMLYVEGKEEVWETVIRTMRDDGESLEKIAHVTHLTVEEVQNILDRPKD